MSDTTTDTEDQAEVAKVRRPHRRVRPIEDEQAAEVADESAEPPVPAAILAIARSRHAVVINRLKADLMSAQQYRLMINGSGDHNELARQQAVREQSIADCTRKLEEAEAIDGWELIRLTRADQSGIYRG